MARMTLKVPKGAVSMQNGTIVEWFVAAGDTVSIGQPIYAIETEKTTLEVESPFAGTITPIADVGQTLPVGAPVATIES
jgi:pyruvate/2-oxoglutarate dehydrogenase complex dihydrolipoamide acyltransferase (E2) component